MACHACFIRIHEAGEHLLLLSNYNLQTARKTNAFLNVILFPPFSEDNLETQQHFQLQKKKDTNRIRKKEKIPIDCSLENQKLLHLHAASAPRE